MGKTTYAIDEAVHMAKMGARVGIFSIERPGVEVIDKFCCSYTGGDSRPTEKAKELGALSVWIDDSGAGLTTSTIMHAVKEDPVDFLIVDYLQLMRHDKHWGNRNNEIDAICQDLQATHKEGALQMLLVSQLSRGVEFRRREDDHARPELQDLRDSGAIEQTADEVLLLHREDYYREFKKNDGVTEVIVAKNRLGPTGVVRVTFIPEEETFV